MHNTKYPEADDLAEDDEDFYEDMDGGRIHTPESAQKVASSLSNAHRKRGRGIAFVGPALVLVLVLSAILWLSSTRGAGGGSFYPVDGAGDNNAAPDSSPRIGSLAPDFELTDVNTGQPVKLSSLNGKPIWINFWASWCPPCKVEMPIMKQVYTKYKNQGLVIVGVDMREKVDEVKLFTGSNGYDWTFVIDSDGQVTDRYFVSGIPSHFFVGKDGLIKSIRVGEMTSGEMEENVSKIFDR